MKSLLFALIVLTSLDAVADHGAGVRACWLLVGRLADQVEDAVGGSVFRS